MFHLLTVIRSAHIFLKAGDGNVNNTVIDKIKLHCIDWNDVFTVCYQPLTVEFNEHCKQKSKSARRMWMRYSPIFAAGNNLGNFVRVNYFVPYRSFQTLYWHKTSLTFFYETYTLQWMEIQWKFELVLLRTSICSLTLLVSLHNANYVFNYFILWIKDALIDLRPSLYMKSWTFWSYNQEKLLERRTVKKKDGQSDQ